MDEADDETLLHRWRDGDQRAGERLVSRHVDTVYRFFRSRVNDEAEDLAHATFVACQESVHRLRNSVSFRAFLLGIARNLLLQHLRKRGRANGPLTAGGVEDPATPISGRVHRHAEQQYLVRALQSLPIGDQLVIGLHYWDKLRTAEIAEVLERPAGTIKWRLAEARKALRAEIERLGRDMPGLVQSTLTGLDKWAASLHADAPEADDDNAES